MSQAKFLCICDVVSYRIRTDVDSSEIWRYSTDNLTLDLYPDYHLGYYVDAAGWEEILPHYHTEIDKWCDPGIEFHKITKFLFNLETDDDGVIAHLVGLIDPALWTKEALCVIEEAQP